MRVAASLRETVEDALAGLGLKPADPAQIGLGHALARRLIGPDIVSVEQLGEVQRHTGLSAFVFMEAGELTGSMAFLLLNAAGHAALATGAFDARNPRLALLSRPGDTPAAYYGWGFAGETRPARTALVAGADLMRRILTWAPFYCHAATPAGRRAVTLKLGYVDVPGSSSGLLWAPPLGAEDRRAA